MGDPPASSRQDETKISWNTKDVECVNFSVCKTWSRITIPKNTNLKNKNFLCGFCSFEKDKTKQNLLELQQDEISKLKSLINEKIENMKTYMTSMLEDLKTDLKPTPLNDVTLTQPQPPKQSKPNRHLNVVMFGCKEEEGNDFKKRFEKMSQTVETNLGNLGITMESSICDFYRRGKRVPGKSRPIILRATNIWEKKKILSGFRAERESQNLSFTIREDYPPNPELQKLKEEARKLNQDLKIKAEKENTSVTKSYSARENGIITYVFRNKKWQQE